MNELMVVAQPENWVHFSSSSAQILMKTRYQQESDKNSFSRLKPKGLWITPEYANNNWREWCEGENFRLDELKYLHDVKLKSNANILRLENETEIKSFTKEYSYVPFPELLFGRDRWISWEKVAEKYQGILIPNYIWECRFSPETFWYYPWDCASGCIWNADAIESITVRKTADAYQ